MNNPLIVQNSILNPNPKTTETSFWQNEWFIAKYKAVSLVEFYLVLVLLILGVSMSNFYILVVLFALLSKHIPEQIIKFCFKEGTLFVKGQVPEFSTRPPGAKDCNMFNSGGPSHTPGVIEGHTFNLSSFTFFLLFTFTGFFSRNLNHKQGTLVAIMFVFTMVLAFSRIGLHCHRPIQTIISFFGGIVWGLVMYFIVEAFVNSYPNIADDKMIVMQMFEVSNEEEEEIDDTETSSQSSQSTGARWNTL